MSQCHPVKDLPLIITQEWIVNITEEDKINQRVFMGAIDRRKKLMVLTLIMIKIRMKIGLNRQGSELEAQIASSSSYYLAVKT